LIRPHPQQGRHLLEEHFRCCEFCCHEQRCHLGTEHDWDDDIHRIRFLDLCQNSNVLRTLCNQEKHVPACQCKLKRERMVAMLKEHIASPAVVLMGGRHSTASATSSGRAAAPSAATRPTGAGNGTGATRYQFSHSNGTGSGGNGGAQRSGNTGRSPRDRNVCAVKASTVTPSFEDDSSLEATDEFIVAKLNGECLGGCNMDHPPCECPNIVGDVAQQKKTFASLSSKRRSLPIWAIATKNPHNDDVDLIDLHDPDDADSDADLDFP